MLSLLKHSLSLPGTLLFFLLPLVLSHSFAGPTSSTQTLIVGAAQGSVLHPSLFLHYPLDPGDSIQSLAFK